MFTIVLYTIQLPIQKYLANVFRKLLTKKSSVFLERFRHFYHLKFEMNQETFEGVKTYQSIRDKFCQNLKKNLCSYFVVFNGTALDTGDLKDLIQEHVSLQAGKRPEYQQKLIYILHEMECIFTKWRDKRKS